MSRKLSKHSALWLAHDSHHEDPDADEDQWLRRQTRVVSPRGSGKSLLFGASALLGWASRNKRLHWYTGDPDMDDFTAIWDDWQVTSSDLHASLQQLLEEVPEDVHPDQQRLFGAKVTRSDD